MEISTKSTAKCRSATRNERPKKNGIGAGPAMLGGAHPKDPLIQGWRNFAPPDVLTYYAHRLHPKRSVVNDDGNYSPKKMARDYENWSPDLIQHPSSSWIARSTETEAPKGSSTKNRHIDYGINPSWTTADFFKGHQNRFTYYHPQM